MRLEQTHYRRADIVAYINITQRCGVLDFSENESIKICDLADVLDDI